MSWIICTRKIYFIYALTLMLFLYIILTWLKLRETSIQIPSIFNAASVSNSSITPITGTRYVMVSAFINDQTNGQVFILTIMKSNPEPNYCLFCCASGRISKSPMNSERHEDHFGFPFVTTDAFCRVEPACNPKYVTISTPENLYKNHQYLPIQVSVRDKREFEVDFTLCLCSLFGEYNNVLQFVQTVETYKLLGVERVIIYNTSHGSDLEKVLLSYKEEGLLEIIPWPIHNFFTPSKGWNYAEFGGELHYYGQQAKLNDCIHRNRQRSKYVLLNDADEIITLYQHSSLKQLIEELQEKNPDAATFMFRNIFFYTEGVNTSDIFDLPDWKHIPGDNVLRYIYRHPVNLNIYNPAKLIVNPRKVSQTSVHEVLKSSRPSIWVPDYFALMMHSSNLKHPEINQKVVTDNIIWKYAERMIPNVNQVLQKTGILIKTDQIL